MRIFNRARLILILVFISLLGHLVNAQKVNMLDSIQGIWKEIRVDDDESLYKIIRGNSSLGISVSKASSGVDIFLFESIIGFQNQSFWEVDSIEVNSLGGAGEYYTEVLDPKLKGRWAKVSDCNLSRFFEYHDNYMAVTVVRMAQYQRINRLPTTELKLLLDLGLRDKRNYIKDFLDADVVEIKVNCPVSAGPGDSTKLVIPKGEVVYLKEIKGAWQKIEYEKNENVQQGWIERKYLK